MKKAFALISLAVLATAAHATGESDHWFNDGLGWYEYPCSFEAFAKYGKADTPENRARYDEALKHPEMCSKLFPVEGAEHAAIRR